MGSGRLPKKRTKKGIMKAIKLEVSGGIPLYFEVESATVEDSRFVYPRNYRGLTCNISNYSSLGTLVDLWSVLSKDEKDLFRTTVIGHLMDIPKKQRWSSAIFCFLMSRQIKVEPEISQNDEMYFRVADKELCFRKTDFSMISGLRFRD
ncbi:hypothetical protein MKW98_024351 [Papaver atlanticum]|uniref:Uncharacterized protein n=1 Tax=Papaver atlanticum TaxID=357466 RepID=A0AAD4T0Q1_9MAGN|nr:hypothetical protein MKW98_024351 [Papaver atlanticum]